MSKYTTEVRYICESLAERETSGGYSDINEIIEKARVKIFDFDFPIYDESYRAVLETKILKHFYFREIGLETFSQWKFYLDTRLNEIMPYYNQLYKSTLLEFNPLFDTDITTDHKTNLSHDETTSRADTYTSTRTDNLSEDSTATSENTNQNSHTGHTTDMFSDTPQGELTDVIDGKYLTQASVGDSMYTTDDVAHTESTGSVRNTGTVKNDGESNDNGTRNFKSTEDYIEHVTGKSAGESYSKRVLDFRKTFLNIDMKIISELSDLFMSLW